MGRPPSTPTTYKCARRHLRLQSQNGIAQQVVIRGHLVTGVGIACTTFIHTMHRCSAGGLEARFRRRTYFWNHRLRERVHIHP